MKSIPTSYKGVIYRSKLEARYASAMDQSGIKHIYEPEGLQFGSVRYLPDFFLPELNMYLEVKGPHAERIEKPRQLYEAIVSRSWDEPHMPDHWDGIFSRHLVPLFKANPWSTFQPNGSHIRQLRANWFDPQVALGDIEGNLIVYRTRQSNNDIKKPRRTSETKIEAGTFGGWICPRCQAKNLDMEYCTANMWLTLHAKLDKKKAFLCHKCSWIPIFPIKGMEKKVTIKRWAFAHLPSQIKRHTF